MSKSKKQTRVNHPRTDAGAAFLEACKGKPPRIRLGTARLARFRKQFAEAGITTRLAGDDLRKAGFAWPDQPTIEDWEFLARVVGEREPGKLTAREIHQIATAWVERIRMKKRIALVAEAEVEARRAACETAKVSREPSPKAFQAYRAVTLVGLSQVAVAGKLDTNQGQVSRYVTQVAAWIKAGNILPDLDAVIGEPADKPIVVAPALLDMGPRRRSGTRSRLTARQNHDSDD